jgi:hypothetical protein
MKRGEYIEDPIGYRVAYSRIAQSLHAKLPAKESEKDEPDGEVNVEERLLGKEAKRTITLLIGTAPPEPSIDVVKDAMRLVTRTRGHLAELGWEWVGSAPRTWRRWVRCRGEALRLAEFLDQIVEPATVVLYHSARLEAEGVTPPVFETPARRKEAMPLLRRRVTADDYFAEVGVAGRPWLDRYLERLTASAAAPRPDPPGFGWKRHSDLNYRVRYNLACMYSRMGGRDVHEETKETRADEISSAWIFDRALDELHRAVLDATGVERDLLVGWARRDPSLRSLKDSVGKKRFGAALLAEPDREEVI